MALITGHTLVGIPRGQIWTAPGGTPPASEGARLSFLWSTGRITQLAWGIAKNQKFPDPSGTATLLPLVASNTVYTVTMSGGATCGGTWDVTSGYTWTTEGGAVCGGDAIVGPNTYGETMSGGVVAGGSAVITANYPFTMSGGVILDGAAIAYATARASFSSTVSLASSVPGDLGFLSRIVLASAFGPSEVYATANTSAAFKSKFRICDADLAGSLRYRR